MKKASSFIAASKSARVPARSFAAHGCGKYGGYDGKNGRPDFSGIIRFSFRRSHASEGVNGFR